MREFREEGEKYARSRPENWSAEDTDCPVSRLRTNGDMVSRRVPGPRHVSGTAPACLSGLWGRGLGGIPYKEKNHGRNHPIGISVFYPGNCCLQSRPQQSYGRKPAESSCGLDHCWMGRGPGMGMHERFRKRREIIGQYRASFIPAGEHRRESGARNLP